MILKGASTPTLRLEKQLLEAEENHKADLELKISALNTEWDNKLHDAVEKARLEGEEKLNAAIDEIRALEGEKRESYVEAERRKVMELESALEALRQSMADMQTEQHNKMSEASSVLEQLNDTRQQLDSLR